VEFPLPDFGSFQQSFHPLLLVFRLPILGVKFLTFQAQAVFRRLSDHSLPFVDSDVSLRLVLVLGPAPRRECFFPPVFLDPPGQEMTFPKEVFFFEILFWTWFPFFPPRRSRPSPFLWNSEPESLLRVPVHVYFRLCFFTLVFLWQRRLNDPGVSCVSV